MESRTINDSTNPVLKHCTHTHTHTHTQASKRASKQKQTNLGEAEEHLSAVSRVLNAGLGVDGAAGQALEVTRKRPEMVRNVACADAVAVEVILHKAVGLPSCVGGELRGEWEGKGREGEGGSVRLIQRYRETQ